MTLLWCWLVLMWACAVLVWVRVALNHRTAKRRQLADRPRRIALLEAEVARPMPTEDELEARIKREDMEAQGLAPFHVPKPSLFGSPASIYGTSVAAVPSVQVERPMTWLTPGTQEPHLCQHPHMQRSFTPHVDTNVCTDCNTTWRYSHTHEWRPVVVSAPNDVRQAPTLARNLCTRCGTFL